MTEELELIEIEINEIGHMMTEAQTDMVAERVVKAGAFNLWLKTDAGFVRVKRVFVLLSDEGMENEGEPGQIC